MSLNSRCVRSNHGLLTAHSHFLWGISRIRECSTTVTTKPRAFAVVFFADFANHIVPPGELEGWNSNQRILERMRGFQFFVDYLFARRRQFDSDNFGSPITRWEA